MLQRVYVKILAGMYLQVKMVSWAGRDQPGLWNMARGGNDADTTTVERGDRRP